MTLLVLVILSAALRLPYIAARSLWLDEAKLFWLTRGTVTDVLRQNAAGNSAPPLFALLIRAISAFGESEAALRALPAAAGILSVPAIFFLTRRFTGSGGALFSAMLVAVSLSQVTYSLELREYSLSFLMATLILVAFVRFFQRPVPANWSLLVTAAVVAVFTQYGLLLLILSLTPVLLIALLSTPPPDRPTARMVAWWGGAQLIILLAGLVVIQLALREQMAFGGFAADSYLTSAYFNGTLRSLARLLLAGTYEIFDFAFRFPYLLILFCGLGLLQAWRSPTGRLAILLLLIPFAVALTAALFSLYPYYGGRQLMFLLPMIYVSAGLGCDYLLTVTASRGTPAWQRLILPGAVALFLLLGVGTTLISFRTANPHLQFSTVQHVRPLAETITASWQPGDAVYAGCRSAPAVNYYLRQTPETVVERQGASLSDYATQLDETLADNDRLWIIFSQCTDPLELDHILDRAAETREITFVQAATGAWLYLAQ